MKKMLHLFFAILMCFSLVTFIPTKAASMQANKQYSLNVKKHETGLPKELTYTIELKQTSIVSIDLSTTSIPTTAMFDLMVYLNPTNASSLPNNVASINTFVAAHQTSNKTSEVVLPKGSYTFTIKYFSSIASQKVNYKVNVKALTDNFAENGYEKNSTYASANSISLYKTYQSSVMCDDMRDCYKVNVPMKAKYDFTINSSMRSYQISIHKLVNNSLQSVFYKSIEEGKGFKTTNTYSVTLDAGNYCVMIEDFPGLDTFSRLESGYYQFNLGVKHSFKDLDANMWYYTTALQAYQTGLMTGTDNTHFSPNANMSRAMVASVLHRIAGGNSVAYKSIFKDVKKNMWYTTSIMWAAQNGVVNGYDNGNFGVDDPITREQMCAMCYKFVKFMTKQDPKGTVSLTKFKDDQNVTKNMKQAMSWAVANGIISGSEDGYLNPTAKATRAQCAKMLLQLSKLVGK